MPNFTAEGCINLDPLFTDAANGDFTLADGSPCRDAGAYAGWMATARDLADNRRIRGKNVDIGCYEGPVAGLIMLFR